MKRIRSASWAFVLLLGMPAPSAAQRFARDVAAPPEDILSGRVRLPDPASIRTLSRAALIPIEPRPDPGGWAFEIELPLDADPAGVRPITLAVVSSDPLAWTVSVAPPGAPALAPAARLADVAHTVAQLDGPLAGFAADRYDLFGARPGTWRVRLEAAGGLPPAPALLLAAGASEPWLASRLTTHALRSDRRIGIAAALIDDASAQAGVDLPLRGWIDAATLHVGGTAGIFELAMVDDGRHGDGVAGDGVYGAWLPRGVAGDVVARVEARGTSPEGVALLRTTRHAFPVLERRAALTGAAATAVEDERRLGIDVGAVLLGAAQKLHLSVEVWGTAPSGERVPVCWLSRMVVPEAPDASGAVRLRLSLDGRWLDRAGASAPLELRRLRLQDPDTNVPLDVRRRVALEAGALPATVGRPPAPITPDMLHGSATAQGAPQPVAPHAPATRQVHERVLLLTHGFCSGGNVWPPGQFSDPKIVFSDPNQARSNDEFALLLRDAGSGALSFGVVAHSQGGMAALHLYTYYASGLDQAQGPRLIQSVGTPYQGTPLAAFGDLTCGTVFDMTPEGAALWLAGIPSWARSEVYYWTTSNGGFFACNFFTDFLLANPDDGVIEQFRGQLPGASSMGHTLGWCHSTGMSEPAHYTDSTRNAQMNAQAAR